MHLFKSIRWKFIMIFFMLVLVAMVVSGAFIIELLQNYHLGIISERLTELSELLIPKIETYESMDDSSQPISEIVKNFKGLGFQEEIFVISAKTNQIVASTSENVQVNALDILDFSLLTQGVLGNEIEKDQVVQTEYSATKIKDKVFPIRSEKGQVVGLLYLRYDLQDTLKTVNQSKIIIIQATLIALSLTVFLGTIISRSITEPINEVTRKAFAMAKGDFNQTVDVKSEDEIGKLAEMFNHMSRRLKISLGEISREKSKFEAIVNNMTDGLIAVNTQNEVLHINPMALRIFGLSSGRFHFDEVVTPFDPALTFKALCGYSEDWIGQRKLYIEESIYLVGYAPFLNDEGEKGGIVLVLQDITEQQKLDNMRKDFVANVSHELKTPLTSIKSYTETLLDGAIEDRETAHQFLEVINSESDRMGRLVKDLLQLSNFDSNKVSLDFEYHDLFHLVQFTVRKMEMQAKAKGQSLKLISEIEELILYMDHDRIEQVFLNILSNAIKYTPEQGKIKVYVYQSGKMVYIKISDTGMGIPEKDLEHVFERFYRVDKARSRELGGTGLGLAIAKEIIEHHKGTIDIKSAPDRGTEVIIGLSIEGVVTAT